MPSGVAKFVGRGQGLDSNTDSPNGKDLARRKAEASGAKVQLKDLHLRTPAKSQIVYDRRIVPPIPTYIEPIRSHEQDGGDLFAGSVLSDSDDTTRDFGSSNMRGYHTTLPTQARQDFGGSNGIEQDSEAGYQDEYREDEDPSYLSNANGMENDLDEEDGHSRAFHLQTGDVPIDNAQLVRFRESPVFAEAQKLHNRKISSSHIPPIPPGISGRFTGVNIFAGDAPRHSTGLGSEAEARHIYHPQVNGQAILDDPIRNDSDEYIIQESLQHEEQKHGVQLERTTRTRTAIERRASFPESEYSGGSSQRSPSQHTPRANGRSNKQMPTASQAGKRKKAELELDYDTDTLSTMKYSELKDQPFDSNPKACGSVIPEDLNGQASLEAYLERFKDSEPHDRNSFFAQMTLDQWERSGDWFLEGFGNIMSRFKEARRTKRDVSKAFEKELATREEAVRGEAESIQEVFRQMRAGGEGVLKGRTS